VHGVTEEQLRALIDEGFVHLTSAQRADVYASLTRMLSDPRNALARPLIIQELAQHASAVRGAHERLAALTTAEKRAIAVDARSEYERLQPQERDQLMQLLKARVAPIPRDLNDLILAEFAAAGALPAPATP
jgi:PHD/YefM family antitoxin component YafN of YafNO toxin-antitoxin module